MSEDQRTAAAPAPESPGAGWPWRRMIVAAASALVVIALGSWLAVGLRGGGDDSGSSQEPGRDSGSGPATQRLNTPAPGLSGPTLTGDSFDLATLRGQPVLVAVWASWCEACRAELQALGEASQTWSGQGPRVIGINVRDDDDQARRLLAEVGADGVTTVIDHDGTIAVSWGVRGIPETFLVDRAGRLRLVARGPITADWLRQQIKPMTGAPLQGGYFTRTNQRNSPPKK